MKNLPVAFLTIVMWCQYANEPQQNSEYKFAKLIYDNGEILRIIPPKTEDLRDWSRASQMHGLDTMMISDSVIMKYLSEVIGKIDISKGVLVSNPTVSAVDLDSLNTASVIYRPDDISATTLLSITKATGEADTLYLGESHSPMRFNDYVISADTAVWNRINCILKKRK